MQYSHNFFFAKWWVIVDLSHPPVTAVISKNAGLYSGIVISAVNTFWKSGSSKTTGIKKKILDF